MAAADGRRTHLRGARRDSAAVRRIRTVIVASIVASGAGCGGAETAQPTFVGVPETVAIGGMPGPLSDTSVPTIPEVAPASTTTTGPPPEPISVPLVDDVDGHRVLLVGDTALAATTPRADGNMCDVVTGFGWDVEIEAEPGRPIGFASEVLDELLDPPTDPPADPDDDAADDAAWDVVGLMFGHHVPATVEEFEQTLDELLERLAPRPVILYTVAELGEVQIEVNRILLERERSWPNVVVIDWAEATGAETDVLLDGGGPVPSEEGAGRLALFTAASLSRVPGDQPGSCLDAVFTDDSAIVL